jgi:hypothetical protein
LSGGIPEAAAKSTGGGAEQQEGERQQADDQHDPDDNRAEKQAGHKRQETGEGPFLGRAAKHLDVETAHGGLVSIRDGRGAGG